MLATGTNARPGGAARSNEGQKMVLIDVMKVGSEMETVIDVTEMDAQTEMM